jgi:membrane associated rhomboid family serine protease
MIDEPVLRTPRTRREPILNAPAAVASLVGLLIAAHALRLATGVDVDRFAFSAADLQAGRWQALITYQFVHGSWAHVLMNAAFCLAFGVPLARLLGERWRGAALFYAFFLACGAVAALAYWLISPKGAWDLVGASGAASGLMGAAARLIEGRGRLGSPFGRTVIVWTIAWIAINAVLGLSGLTPGAAGVPVAWQAHIFGYLAGLVLVSPAAWLAGTDHEAGAGPT